MKKISIIVMFLLLLSRTLYSGGFQINEHSARSMAMGSAFTGLADDASAAFFNPAAISQFGGTKFSIGATIIKPMAYFRGPSPETTEYKLNEQYFNPINIYFTHKINEDFSFGFAVNNPFGLGTEWDDDWVGRYLALKTDVETYFVTPVLSYKINDQLSIGGGISYVYANVHISKYKNLVPFDGEAKITMEGDDKSSFGYTASLFYKPSNKLSFGLCFKSEVEINFEGDVKSEGPSQFAAILPRGDIEADLTTPLTITIGAAYKPSEKLTFTADYQYIGWSSYNNMTVVFKENSDWNTISERDYKNTYIIRTGAEYNYNKKLALRVGLYLDKHPVKDKMSEPSLPDSDRLGFNYGIGYKFTPNFSMDIAYLYMRFTEKKIDESDVIYTDGDTPLIGVYNSTAHLFGMNFNYNL